MVQKKEYPLFRNLLITAIGDRSQAEFAKRSGISPEHISRMLNNSYINRPSLSTLRKIAGNANGGITLDELKSACGYEESTSKIRENETGEEFIERVRVKALERASYLEAIVDFTDFEESYWTSIYDFVSSLFKDIEIGIKVGDTTTISATDHIYGCMVTLSWGEDEYYAEAHMVVHFHEDEPGDEILKVIDGAYFSAKSLTPLNNTPRNKGIQYLPEDEECLAVENTVYKGISCIIWYRRIGSISTRADSNVRKARRNREIKDIMDANPGISSSEALLKMIFDERPNRYLTSVEGYGFYVDNMPDYIARRFLEAHQGTYVQAEDDKETFERIKSGETPEDGFIEEIAKVMRRETGIKFCAWEKDDLEKGNSLCNTNRSCIMLEKLMPFEMNETEKNLSCQSLQQIIDRYAAELHCEVDWCVYYMMTDKTDYIE